MLAEKALALLAGAVALCLWYHLSLKKKASPHTSILPPGPKGLPFVHSLFEVPTEVRILIVLDLETNL